MLLYTYAAARVGRQEPNTNMLYRFQR